MYIGNYITFTKYANGRIVYDSVKSVDGRRRSYLRWWYLDMLKSMEEMGFDIQELDEDLPEYGKVIEAVKGSRAVIKDGKRIVRHALLYWSEFNATEMWKKNGNR